MRHAYLISVASLTLLLCAACSQAKRYPLVGQVVAVNADQQVLTVKHEDIRGFMPGMTMPFKVKDAAVLAASKPGDLITATLVIEDNVGYLDEIKKTGEAPLPAGLPMSPAGPVIEAGAEVPDAVFTDQDGQTVSLRDWRGTTLAVTFVYTRCPVPNFCPLMDRNFAATQNAIKADLALAGRVRLLSVSFDPDYDTPAVLKQHAARAGADPEVWSYLTGTRENIDRFGSAFGITIIRPDGKMEEIVHNLRTAVIDANGRLVKILSGNDWKPEELMATIRAADAVR